MVEKSVFTREKMRKFDRIVFDFLLNEANEMFKGVGWALLPFVKLSEIKEEYAHLKASKLWILTRSFAKVFKIFVYPWPYYDLFHV